MTTPTEAVKYSSVVKAGYTSAVIMVIVATMSLAAAWANAENDEVVSLDKVKYELTRLAQNIQSDMEKQTSRTQAAIDNFAFNLNQDKKYYNIAYTNDTVRQQIKVDTIKEFKSLRDDGKMEYVSYKSTD